MASTTLAIPDHLVKRLRARNQFRRRRQKAAPPLDAPTLIRRAAAPKLVTPPLPRFRLAAAPQVLTGN